MLDKTLEVAEQFLYRKGADEVERTGGALPLTYTLDGCRCFAFVGAYQEELPECGVSAEGRRTAERCALGWMAANETEPFVKLRFDDIAVVWGDGGKVLLRFNPNVLGSE